jgi:hypothetical protein
MFRYDLRIDIHIWRHKKSCRNSTTAGIKRASSFTTLLAVRIQAVRLSCVFDSRIALLGHRWLIRLRLIELLRRTRDVVGRRRFEKVARFKSDRVNLTRHLKGDFQSASFNKDICSHLQQGSLPLGRCLQ